MDGAASAFFELGFEGASADEIAARAGVSKATMYKYYSSKTELFKAFVERESRSNASGIAVQYSPDADIEDLIFAMARELVVVVTKPVIVDIYRVCVAEARRFPELTQTFFLRGPAFAFGQIAKALESAADDGKLDIDDPLLAAQNLDQLCKATLFNKALFGMQEKFSDEEIDREARQATNFFLRVYRASA